MRAWLSLGGNIGDRRFYLSGAAAALAAHPALTLTGKSSLYRSTAWGKRDQADFFNAAVTVQGKLMPDELLDVCQQIELDFGRERHERWGARTLDIDVIAVAGIVSDRPRLLLPHPRAMERLFVLLPLAEIAADDEPFPGCSLAQLIVAVRIADPASQVEKIADPAEW